MAKKGKDTSMNEHLEALLECAQDPADMTYEELSAEADRLWEIRQAAKAAQMVLVPFIEALSAAETARRAALADPNLEQNLGG
jgi:5-formyltetrahydrofolate cyclo-ligase